MNGKELSRCDFLREAAGASVAAVGFPYFVPASALGQAGTVAPSNRIVIGCIGVGGQGTHNMNAFMGNPDADLMLIRPMRRPWRL